MSGVFQPDTQGQTRAQIQALEENLGATQNLSSQNLTSFSGLDNQINKLRQDLTGQNTTAQNQLAQLEQTQKDLIARQAAQESAIAEQISSLKAQVETTNAIELPPTSTPFDPTPLLQQIADLDAKLDAIAAGASNEDAQKLSADIAQMQNELSAVQIQLDQRGQNWDTQFVQLNEKLDQQSERFDTINSLITQNSDQLKQQDLLLSGLSLSTAELMQTTNELQQTTQEISDAAKTAELSDVQSDPISATPVQIQQIPFALMSIEIALNNGQPFLYQLESLAAQTKGLDTNPELLHAAADGLAIPGEIAAEFDRLIPVVLSARPTNPDASYLDRIGDSIKSILGLRATGLENGDEFENLLNQSLAAIKVSDFSKAQLLLDNLPAPMRANLGDLNQQIALHANIQSLMASVNDMQLENTALPPPAPQTQPTQPAPELNSVAVPEPAGSEPVPISQPTPGPEQQPTPVSDEATS